MTDAVPVYRAVMLELERRRQQLGVSMERFSEFAGLPDRSYAKILWPDGSAGRQATWETVQTVISALFPDGFDLVIKPRKGPELDLLSQKFRARFGYGFTNRKALREHMAELGHSGGEASGESRRRAAAKKAVHRAAGKLGASIRWKTPKVVEITGLRADSAKGPKRHSKRRPPT